MNTEQLKHFNAQLMQGISVLEQLENLLNAERTALSSRQLEEIQDSTEQKQALLTRYLELNKDRVTLLQNLGYSPDSEGVNNLIATAPPTAQTVLNDSWSKLQNKLSSLQESNKINGLISSRNLKNIEQLLSIMSGRSAKDRLYNQKGSAGHYRAQSRIGKA
ncbi:flagellar protein FlgN [Pontibacterium sp. N1Y112]|uniref:Flagellar protein FlgN n=1 Tax=Pontibacterium sinense TaxID=2781979 RepID=A0A8J7FFK1_9GAMM|nr:flagellar protein FlgN [Pontibacterium sinense]MBE9396353.1 flagellar protein FlgN [Pontibacterium sinense]